MTPEEIKALQDSKAASDAELAKLRDENKSLKEKNTPPPPEDDLKIKAEKDRKAKEDEKASSKRVERALSFNLGVDELVKANKVFLPSSAESILAAAKKETYDSAVQKANAVRSALVQEFFSVKDNVELLTASQKETLDEFLGLTKNAREDKSESIYENILEPALGMLKKIRKAEELAKSKAGIVDASDVDEGYKQRLIKQAKAAHLGQKGD